MSSEHVMATPGPHSPPCCPFPHDQTQADLEVCRVTWGHQPDAFGTWSS